MQHGFTAAGLVAQGAVGLVEETATTAGAEQDHQIGEGLTEPADHHIGPGLQA